MPKQSNHSVAALPNGGPAGPAQKFAVHFRQPGPGVPPHLERQASTEIYMATLDAVKEAANSKRKECAILAHAYAATLAALAPANFILVVGAALLSLVAGATVLVDENGILTHLQAGVLALVSGSLTIVHSKLGCEQYQGECKRLLSFYRGIAEDYSNLQFESNEGELRTKFFALNDLLSTTLKGATAVPYERHIARAKECVD